MSITRKKRARGESRARRWNKSDAAVAVHEWKKSGLSAEVFAGSRGYSGERLRRWGHRLQGAEFQSPVAFVPVAVTTSAMTVTPQEIVIEVGEVIVRVREDLDTDRVARFVGALARTMREC